MATQFDPNLPTHLAILAKASAGACADLLGLLPRNQLPDDEGGRAELARSLRDVVVRAKRVIEELEPLV